jgi:hypothetical protein
MPKERLVIRSPSIPLSDISGRSDREPEEYPEDVVVDVTDLLSEGTYWSSGLLLAERKGMNMLALRKLGSPEQAEDGEWYDYSILYTWYSSPRRSVFEVQGEERVFTSLDELQPAIEGTGTLFDCFDLF